MNVTDQFFSAYSPLQGPQLSPKVEILEPCWSGEITGAIRGHCAVPPLKEIIN